MTHFDTEQVRKLALLSRLELDDAQVEGMGRELGAILTHIEQLNELDTEGVEPSAHAFEISNVMREDRARPSLPVEASLANAPEREAHCFRVPQVIQES